MTDSTEILTLLDEQFGDYRAMYSIGLEQRDCIDRDDMLGLEKAFARMQELMDRVRLRQQRIPAPMGNDTEVVARVETIRDLLYKIEGLRYGAQETAEKLLAKTRGEMRQMGKGRQAFRGYQSAGPGQSRLYDGTR
jgi:hypothetical protein